MQRASEKDQPAHTRKGVFHIAWLNYTYDNLHRPSGFLPLAQAAKTNCVQARINGDSSTPLIGLFPSSAAKTINSTTQSLGGARCINFGDNSVSVRVLLPYSG